VICRSAKSDVLPTVLDSSCRLSLQCRSRQQYHNISIKIISSEIRRHDVGLSLLKYLSAQRYTGIISCDDAMRTPSRWLQIMVRAPVPRLLVLLFYSASIANTYSHFSINPVPSPGLYPVHTNTVFKLRDTPQSFATKTLRGVLPTYCLDIVRLISYRIFTPRFLTRTVINGMR